MRTLILFMLALAACSTVAPNDPEVLMVIAGEDAASGPINHILAFGTIVHPEELRGPAEYAAARKEDGWRFTVFPYAADTMVVYRGVDTFVSDGNRTIQEKMN